MDLLGPGASEDEIVAYATMLSEEAARTDEARRKSESDGSVISRTEGPPIVSNFEDETDPDIAEAIRISLQEAEGIPSSPPQATHLMDFPMKYAKKKRSPSSSPPRGTAAAGSSLKPEADDLAFALQLSLAKEESRREVEDVPMLSKNPSPPVEGKGKRWGS